MFSFNELLLVVVLAFIVLGPKRFIGLMRQVAVWVGAFKRGKAEVMSTLTDKIDE